MSAFGRVKLFGKLATRNNKVDSHTVASLTGTPEQLLEERTARIFRPSRSTMQSGSLKTKVWKLQFDKEGMWRSPLMGWTGSGDPVQALSFEFKTKEEAITQAEQLVEEDTENLPPQAEKSYADNFKYKPVKKMPF